MAAPPAFNSRNPLDPGFWDERFERGFMPWDRGGVPQALRDFSASRPPMRTLIPGCGAAYELAYLSEQGWDATAIDFSPAAVQTARTSFPQWADRVVQADFFAYQPPRTLRTDLRARLPVRLAENDVATGGRALRSPAAHRRRAGGLFLLRYKRERAAVWHHARAAGRLAVAAFRAHRRCAVSDSIAVFEGKERWQIWRRR